MSQTNILPKKGFRCFRLARSMTTLRGARCAFLPASQFSAATENNCAARCFSIRLKALLQLSAPGPLGVPCNRLALAFGAFLNFLSGEAEVVPPGPPPFV